MLLSWANVAFYQELMAAMRSAIAEALRRVGGGDRRGSVRWGQTPTSTKAIETPRQRGV
jgi:hypothetical protein